MSEKHDAMWGEAGEEIASLHAEIERLRAALQSIADDHDGSGRLSVKARAALKDKP